MDKRWKQLGDLLVNYCAEVKPGQRVMIAMIEIETYDLMKCVYDSVIRAGGYPQVQFLSEELRHSLLQGGNDKQISWLPEMEMWGMEWADVYIALRGAHNLYEMHDIASDRLSVQQKVLGEVSTSRWKNTRWVLIRVPTVAYAMQAKCDYETILEMFFSSCFLDWESEKKKWGRWSETLNKGKQVRIVGQGSDLTMSVEGRKWIPACGGNNMPDGEIATAPVCESVDGTIYFENPAVLSGRLVYGLTLTWEQGKLVRAKSDTEQVFLQSILNTDAGSSQIGELAIGTNPNVNRFCNDILSDEKIYGTMHIALGRAYPESGGTNKSAIHWDIIKDTRIPGSTIYLDGRPILKDGEILLDQ
jgi:aminopeptidase